MSKNIISDELEVMLHKIVQSAHNGDEQAMNGLDTIKEWLKNN